MDVDLYKHPTVAAALTDAQRFINRWINRRDHAAVKLVMAEQHWGVWSTLVEGIAELMLHAQGFDLDDLETMVQGSLYSPETVSDVFARFDAGERWDWGEP